MAGPDSQQIGDQAAAAIEHVLAKAGFVTGRLDPDLGEDLWVEIDGRRASADGAFPYRALLQVKGAGEISSGTFTYDLSVKHIRRWTAQILPLFVVGVDLAGDRFFAKSIDEIVSGDLRGKDPMQLSGATVRVHLPAAQDLPSQLRTAIEEHYRSSQLVLAGLDRDLIEQDYFEVLERKAPEPGLRVPIASWKVIWKSPRRAQHFAAMLTELARLAAEEYASAKPRPAFVVFHIYRSQFDLHRNLAAARVDWVDPSHPKSAEITRVLGAPGAFQQRVDKDLEAMREIFRARTASPVDYREYSTRVGTLLDEVTDTLLARPALEGWDDQIIARFDLLDALWNEGPDAPVECAQLESMLKAHYHAVFDSYFVSKHRRHALPITTLERLLRQSLDRMGHCRGAWRILVRP